MTSTPKYFESAYAQNPKIRWVCKALTLGRLINLEELGELINAKVSRIAQRKGELEQEAVNRIVENYVIAKASRKLLDRRIKPYRTKSHKKSPTHGFKDNFPDLGFTYEMSQASIYKEKHYRLRKHPSILFPGFVPDGNEAFYILRKSFLKYGSVYYLNYPSKNYHRETLFHQLFDLIFEINNSLVKNAGIKSSPFLIGTSFGCGVILNFIRWLQANNLFSRLDISGLVLISPVLCIEDVVDRSAKRQRTLVGRAISHLLEADPKDPEAVAKAMGKGRSIFQKMFSAGRDFLNVEAQELIPVLAVEDEVLRFFQKEVGIETGFFRRYLDLRDEEPLKVEYLTHLNTLVLFAEGEGDVMTPEAPTFETLSDIEKVRTIFPNGSVEMVYSKDSGRKVTHSDLIFQADRFRDHLEPWLKRVVQ